MIISVHLLWSWSSPWIWWLWRQLTAFIVRHVRRLVWRKGDETRGDPERLQEGQPEAEKSDTDEFYCEYDSTWETEEHQVPVIRIRRTVESRNVSKDAVFGPALLL